jgi:hypothetical protein
LHLTTPGCVCLSAPPVVDTQIVARLPYDNVLYQWHPHDYAKCPGVSLTQS